VLVDDMPGAGDLAVSGNGQTVYCLDDDRRAVVAIDPGAPDRRRDVVAAAAAGQPAPVAVASLPGDLLALVCTSGDEWSLRTHRIRPAAAADPSAPLQALPIGRGPAAAPSVRMAVSHSRNWLAVAGLPVPLDPVLRAVFAGAGLRPLSATGCPAVRPGSRPVAIAIGPADEMVLLEQAGDGTGTTSLVFHGPTGRELLRLDTGLARVCGAAFGRGDGQLWVIGGRAGSVDEPEGLWRLDAVMKAGRQAVRPTCVARLSAPRAVACLAEGAVVVTHGDRRRVVVRIDPVAAEPRRLDEAADDEENPEP
jgi:hypothetical protein